MNKYIKPSISIIDIETMSFIACSCGCYNTTDEYGTHHRNCDCPSCNNNHYSNDEYEAL